MTRLKVNSLYVQAVTGVGQRRRWYALLVAWAIARRQSQAAMGSMHVLTWLYNASYVQLQQQALYWGVDISTATDKWSAFDLLKQHIEQLENKRYHA